MEFFSSTIWKHCKVTLYKILCKEFSLGVCFWGVVYVKEKEGGRLLMFVYVCERKKIKSF